MSKLATFLVGYSAGTTLRLYREIWRTKIGGLRKTVLVIDDPSRAIMAEDYILDHKTGKEVLVRAPHAITKSDINATDWRIDGGKKLPKSYPEQQFWFVTNMAHALDRNRLISLYGWPTDRWLCNQGNMADTYGLVSADKSVNDWVPTVNELTNINWYATTDYAPINICNELQDSYLDYAMSVIMSRALPDVRDGFKPVHRRVIHAMSELGNTSNKAYKKSARVVGDVIGKYHPHGDSAVYETIVRMAQDFSLRYTLVDGHGNFGSIDGDSAAAMRYTEIRMQPLTEAMVSDLQLDTVEWVDNYDGTEQIPDVLPTRFPNLVVNGSSGIAVGMATNMAPHNMSEAVNAAIALLYNPHLTDQELLNYIPAPDFPTGGTIRGLNGARQAILTGKGRIVITSKYHIENTGRGGATIVFTEIPYNANKAKIVTKIAELVKDKKLDGISNIQDESDREGMRIAVHCSRDANPDVVLNNLLNANTDLETSFSVNNRAIVNGAPMLLNMRQMLMYFLDFRIEVVLRRTRHLIGRARAKAHELEGLVTALLNIDQVISTIKASPDTAAAKAAISAIVFKAKPIRDVLGVYPELISSDYGFSNDGKAYRLTEVQAEKIVGMRLSALTGLEKDRIRAEFAEALNYVTYLNTILTDQSVMNGVIRDELLATIPKGDKRRSVIDLNEHRAAAIEELIVDEEVVVTLSRTGWIKTQPLKEYTSQNRGGRGKSATALKEDDYVRSILTTSAHQTIMMFTTHGRVHWVKVYDLPSGSRGARGKPVQNFIRLNEGEEVTTMLPVREFGESEYVFMVSRAGVVKRTALSNFSNIRSQGINAMGLNDGDTVVGCAVTDGKSHIMLFSSEGKAIHFEETQVRSMGREAIGVRGMNLPKDAFIQSLVVVPEGGEVLCVCENGYGKRTPVSEFTIHNRGGMGVIAINASKRNGNFVGAAPIRPSSEVMICTDAGVVIRMDSQTISKASRNTQGVKLINLDDGAKVIAVESIDVIDAGSESPKPKVKKKRK